MTTPRFIQIHALQNYTGTLLNRDDSGLAKTMPYGGVSRTRISSQCLKRHWRKAEGEYALTNVAPDPVRTRELADLAVMTGVKENVGSIDEETIAAVLEELNIGLYGNRGNESNARQPLLFGQPEVEFLVERVSRILLNYPPEEATNHVKDLFSRRSQGPNFMVFRENQQLPAGIIGAMFGRMMTSDTSANIDAAVHVAHAFTTHGEEKEIDYFTAMEDLSRGEPGAGHIGDTEINSGIYYSYVCVDVATLVSNTTGCPIEGWLDQDREIAAETTANLTGLIATVSPGAKKGSTAPYGYAKAMLVEAGDRQPRSLSAAYREPSAPQFSDAIAKLNKEVRCTDEIYGGHEARRLLTNTDTPSDNTLSDITKWVREIIVAGDA